MPIDTKTMKAPGDATRDGLTLSGRVEFWRGPGGGQVALERREGETAPWRRTGDVLLEEGSLALDLGFVGNLQYRMVCTVAPDAPNTNPILVEIVR